MSVERDLFGNPIQAPKRRGRRARAGEQRRARRRPTASSGPGLDDLVARLKPLHRRLEADLTQTLRGDATLQREVAARCEELSRQQGVAVSEHQYVHTAATVYVLKTLFLKVAEDYGLFPPPARKVALRGDIFRTLRDLAPRLTWADYLEYAVRDLAYLPVAYDLFKETGYELIPPSDEMARDLLDTVAHLPDLRAMDTRALGDLYEHLMDEEERKRLGYYTTPDFIIDFLLERTLEPAVREFGVYELRYLDPACGTGHFLVRAYRRLDQHLAREDPDLTPLERFERIVENNLFGIDISEFATRITLFRLFLEGVRLAQQEGIEPARWGEDITFNVYTANTLIKLPQERTEMPLFEWGQPPRRETDPVASWYGRELTHLRVDLRDVLVKKFHVINANPPYVRIHRQEAEVVAPVNGSWEWVDFVQYLRDNYETAYKQFDLSVPFVERGLELLVPGGYLGYITSGKFAKQAYGKKLTRLLADGRYRLLFFADLTDARVFDASAYPALLIVQKPDDDTPVPADAPVEVLATYQPAAQTREENWAALRSLLAREGDVFEEYAGHYRERQDHFRSHPWTLRRSGHDLLAKIKAASDKTLADYVERIGEDFQSNADPVFCDYITESFIRRNRLEREICIPCLRGENIRNWTVTWHGNRKKKQTYVIATGVGLIDDIEQYPNVARYLRRYRPYLEARRIYGDSLMKIRKWYEFWWWGARLGVPKIAWPEVATHNHFIGWEAADTLARHSCETAYLKPDLENDDVQLLVGFLNSAVFAYAVKATSTKLSGATEAQARFRWRKDVLKLAPVVSLEILRDNRRFVSSVRQMAEVSGKLQSLSVHSVVRGNASRSASELRAALNELASEVHGCLEQMQRLQMELDEAVCGALGLHTSIDLDVLRQPAFQRVWNSTDLTDDIRFEIRDYICDLIEDIFAAQPQLRERPLTPAEIAGILAQNPKFEPLRAVYYGGRPISAEQFVRECMDWDCRPIPFDEEKVLVGRRPKRVDVLHERFFRFDGVSTGGSETRLYGWTGWSPEAQANIFLTLAEEAQDKTPFYRWVARLISLPEEAPDIEDPEVREGIRSIIGDVEPYPYVVMG